MITRFRFYRLALDENERQTNVPDVDVLPIPTLDERVNIYLRAVHGSREFTEEERMNARNALLDTMAADIATNAEAAPVESPPDDVRGLGPVPLARADRTSLLPQFYVTSDVLSDVEVSRREEPDQIRECTAEAEVTGLRSLRVRSLRVRSLRVQLALALILVFILLTIGIAARLGDDDTPATATLKAGKPASEAGQRRLVP